MFGSKFSNKCKQAAKCIRARVEPIRKKKQATVRFLKKDVADLLAAGHDDNAFGRIDALIVEMNHTSCYDTIEKCCEYIVRKIPSLEKQRECSQEVMEVMGTLIFAAARFPDLPELCDLRHVFMERYGGDMQSSANAEFVEKIQKKTFSKEKKLQIMQIIAEEFSIRWDSHLFGHKLSNLPASKSDPTKKVVPSNTNDKSPSALVNEVKEVLPSRDKLEHTPASLPRRQEMPREAKAVQVVLTSNNAPDNVEQYARHPKVPPHVGSRNTYNVAHGEDELTDMLHNRRAKAQDELNSVGQEKQGLGTIQYWDDKPVKLVPPYAKSSGHNNGYNIEGTKRNGMPPYAKADEVKNLLPVKEKIESVLESVQPGHHEERQEPPHQGRTSVQPANNNVRVANLIPPYVKPKAKEIVQEDPLVKNFNVAGYDNSKDIEDRDDKMNGYYIEKPKPFSVRRNHRNVPTMETECTPISEEKPSSYAYGGERRPINKQSAIVYDENISIENARPPIDDEITSAFDNGIPMPRTSKGQRKGGNKHLVDAYDGKYDETDICDGNPSYHTNGGRRYKVEQNTVTNDEITSAFGNGIQMPRTSRGQRRDGNKHLADAYDGKFDETDICDEKSSYHTNGGRRYKVEQNTVTSDEMTSAFGNGIPMPRTSRGQRKDGNKHFADAYDGKFDARDICDEKLSYHTNGGRRYKVEQNTVAHHERKTKNSKMSMDEDENENAIDFGNLFARPSEGQRRHGSRHHAAVYDGDYDDEEMAIDRLLVHYSRKGTDRDDPGKERRNKIPSAVPPAAANELPSNGEVRSRRKELNHHLERALSMPSEPVSPKVIKAPARALSMKADVVTPNCGRVHPSLPDYDHLAARLAALRRT